ncbi:hypothetical protein THOG11_20360 [Vibrio harveyi]|nr:hypothetical protein TH15OA1_530039 [Vibrio harveyi]CAH1557028.1 hypothetical protein THOD03_20355 [Vibrio harveyi]CAH1564175.1 hypothetical protein THOG11_20360 [Vibrio harveyi]CAK6716396.1 hypothetical protein HORM4_830075 [Vibrio harveyi]
MQCFVIMGRIVYSVRGVKEGKGGDKVCGIEIKKPDKTAELLRTR